MIKPEINFNNLEILKRIYLKSYQQLIKLETIIIICVRLFSFARANHPNLNVPH